MYGAQAVEYTVRARHDREQLERAGFGALPVCMAKTQQSLSDNPALLGRPRDFIVNVREIQLAAGAGFVVPITGEIMRMPGLPRVPTSNRFDLTDEGEIVLRTTDKTGP
jgi:formate--tetrahydrofolate ligase